MDFDERRRFLTSRSPRSPNGGIYREQSYRFRRPSVRGLRLGLTPPEVRYEELYVSR